MSDWCDCTDERSVPWRPSQKRTEPAESPVTTERSAKRSTDHTSGGFRACPSSSIRETSVRAASVAALLPTLQSSSALAVDCEGEGLSRAGR